jgi:hypothetical protein
MFSLLPPTHRMRRPASLYRMAAEVNFPMIITTWCWSLTAADSWEQRRVEFYLHLIYVFMIKHKNLTGKKLCRKTYQTLPKIRELKAYNILQENVIENGAHIFVKEIYISLTENMYCSWTVYWHFEEYVRDVTKSALHRKIFRPSHEFVATKLWFLLKDPHLYRCFPSPSDKKWCHLRRLFIFGKK